MRPTLLIDGNNLLVRAVEATRRAAMNAADGTDTSALVAFTKTLARHLREEQPFRAVVLWDAGYARRLALYPDYKATRPQVTDPYRSHSRALAYEFLTLARIPQQRVEGEEADDLIAAHWRTATAPVVVLSSDKDLLQLVGETPTGQTCEQIRLSSWDTPTDRWDAARVAEHFGCTPAQLPLAMALAGDSSDNIPGVSRIGMKTAVKHLSAAGWDLTAVEHPGIVAAREDGSVAVYRQLVDLRETTLAVPPIPPLSLTTPGPDQDWRALAGFLARYQLKDLERRMIAGDLW